MKSYTIKIPNSVTYHNALITNLDDICYILNNYFVNIGTALANSIPDYTNLTPTFFAIEVVTKSF